MAIFLIAAAIAASLPQTVAPADSAHRPPVTAARVASGAIILPFAIDSDPPAELDLDGKIDSELTDRAAPDSSGRRSPAQQASDDALDEAFEDALDMARFGHPY